MRTSLDLSPFRRAMVGFDRLFDLLQDEGWDATDNYPPFDLQQQGEDAYRITLAVAGFRPDEIDVTAQQNLLIVSGRKAEEDGRTYVHRGIAARSFERRFVMGDYVQVKSADLSDGLLTIQLKREVPEEMRPKTIPIGSASGAQPRLAGHKASDAVNHNREGERVAA